jgi:cysteine desulfurase
MFNFNRKRKVYLDNAAATPVCVESIAAMSKMEKYYANPSAIHEAGVEAKRILESSRETVSKLINSRKNEVYFTSSGTESINLALTGLVNSYYHNMLTQTKTNSTVIPKIITTRIEHSATLMTLKNLEFENKIQIIYLDVDSNGFIIIDKLINLLNSSGNSNALNILGVSIIYANNEIGVVQKAKEIGRVIHLYNLKVNDGDAKIFFHLDACQAVNYLDIDVYKLRCHLMSFNSSKIYGPKGIAALYLSNILTLQPVLHGGQQENSLRSGTENLVGTAGFAAALVKSSKVKVNEINRLLEIQEMTINLIKKEIKEALIYTPINNSDKLLNIKTSSHIELKSIPNIINIGLPGIRSDEVVIRMSELGYYVSHKSACDSINEMGSYVLAAIGRSSTESNENIRISMGRGTTIKEMELFVTNLKNLYYRFRSIS